ncbi:MAG: Ni/Fe-hydrogenase, b-type cytochrome subunit [Candidatus Marinarcus sp.]|uniref:Ni/Fe-hydrogenase, b-type cytochrome subunit n=1 Tax=Candidatus Marinarcus sp. TaxID=3100987 RepID=UPI003B00CD25
MIERIYEFSGVLRFNHWVRVVTMLVLVVTGFYIAKPFLTPYVTDEPVNFMNALWRFWHLVFGFILIATTLVKIYLFIFDRQSKNERVSFFDFISPKIWIQQIKYYMLIGKHPHGRGIYNPLQFIAYFIIFMTLFLISLTGMILYVHVYHDGLGGFFYEILRPFEMLMGGLANVREIHHITMWIFLFFIPVHIYMAVFNSLYGKSGSMDAIFSGYTWHTQHKEHKEHKK